MAAMESDRTRDHRAQARHTQETILASDSCTRSCGGAEARTPTIVPKSRRWANASPDFPTKRSQKGCVVGTDLVELATRNVDIHHDATKEN